MLYDYLKENYIPGEPIFTGDICISGMTEENLRYHLKKLTDSGIICRFEPGVYYFPKTDILGEPMTLTADTVAVHKYIMRRGNGLDIILDTHWQTAWDYPYRSRLCKK